MDVTRCDIHLVFSWYSGIRTGKIDNFRERFAIVHVISIPLLCDCFKSSTKSYHEMRFWVNLQNSNVLKITE